MFLYAALPVIDAPDCEVSLVWKLDYSFLKKRGQIDDETAVAVVVVERCLAPCAFVLSFFFFPAVWCAGVILRGNDR